MATLGRTPVLVAYSILNGVFGYMGLFRKVSRVPGSLMAEIY